MSTVFTIDGPKQPKTSKQNRYQPRTPPELAAFADVFRRINPSLLNVVRTHGLEPFITMEREDRLFCGHAILEHSKVANHTASVNEHSGLVNLDVLVGTQDTRMFLENHADREKVGRWSRLKTPGHVHMTTGDRLRQRYKMGNRPKTANQQFPQKTWRGTDLVISFRPHFKKEEKDLAHKIWSLVQEEEAVDHQDWAPVPDRDPKSTKVVSWGDPEEDPETYWDDVKTAYRGFFTELFGVVATGINLPTMEEVLKQAEIRRVQTPIGKVILHKLRSVQSTSRHGRRLFTGN